MKSSDIRKLAPRKRFTTKRPTPTERFMKFVMPEPNTGCWFWSGAVDADGYGGFYFNYIIEKAHRFSYMTFRGEIPPSMIVCHSCDQPSCVNPDHLFLGTYLDNRNDMLKKGRGRIIKGESVGLSKLTEIQVIEIRRLGSEGMRGSEISKKFDVTTSTINKILRNELWTHI